MAQNPKPQRGEVIIYIEIWFESFPGYFAPMVLDDCRCPIPAALPQAKILRTDGAR